MDKLKHVLQKRCAEAVSGQLLNQQPEHALDLHGLLASAAA